MLNKFVSFKTFIMATSIVTLLAGCVTTHSTVDEKRAAVNNMRTEVLEQLYTQKPSVRAQINNAVGYAVFDNANVNVILASFGGGYGMAVNQQTGATTYMKMGEAGIGFGAGVKNFSLVLVFDSVAAMDRFIDKGWAFGAQADASAKAGEQGGAVGGEATVDDITIYQITQSGLSLQATVKGTKFWKDQSLN